MLDGEMRRVAVVGMFKGGRIGMKRILSALFRLMLI